MRGPTPSSDEPTTGGTLARRRLSGSCLWLDVAGFSALTDRASSGGATGIETLSEILTRVYGDIDAVVRSHQGEVLFFAGDGALCFWNAASSAELSDSIWSAAQTALRLRSLLSSRDYSGFRPQLRQIVLSGRWSLCRLGGVEGVPLRVLTGVALFGLGPLMKLCGQNQIVSTSRSARALGSRATFAPLSRHAHELSALAPELGRGQFRREDALRVDAGLSASGLNQSLMSLPAELRRVSLVYVATQPRCLPSLAALQQLTLVIQRASQREAGHLCQFVHDDKGIVFLLAFGLPGQSRGEDAVRAVRCALQVAEENQARPFRLGVGVATGTVFCGAVGGAERRQYSVIGNPVIRAARLAGRDEGRTLIDSETFQQVARRFEFEAMGSLNLKGVEQPISAYRPLRRQSALAAPLQLVGRDQEQAALQARLRAFAVEPAPSVLSLEGDLGVGKTALLSTLFPLAAELGIECFSCTADALDQHAPYVSIHPLCRAVLGHNGRAEALLEALSRVEGGIELSALLNPVIASEFRASERVQQMSPAARREMRLALIGQLFELRLARKKCLVVIDDAQWLDASSVELIQHLRERLPAILWVFAQRRSAAEATAQPSESSTVERWNIGPLDERGIERLIQSVAKAERVERGLRVSIERTTQGNPLHAIELTHGLLATRQAVLEADGLLAPARDRDLVLVPGTLEELIQSRFDRLSATARGVLWAASVLGMSFEREILGEILRPGLAAGELDGALTEISGDGVVVQGEAFRFAHASMQSVIYGLLPPSEQTGLHSRAGQALESTYSESLPRVAARLAHHFARAGDVARAVRYSALAAGQALDGYAHADAIYLFQRALSEDEQLRGPLAIDLDRARWSASLAQALYSESRHREARQAYERALAWTGCPTPKEGAGQALGYALRLAFGSALTVFGSEPKLVDGVTRERHLAAMRVMHDSGALDVWEGKFLSAASKAMLAYRLSGGVGIAPEAAEALADIGYMLGSTPARRYASGLLRRGTALADVTGNLEARTSTRVLLGMSLTAAGRSAEADAPLREAEALAERLGSGLWRHRSCFGRAEALLFAGRLPEADAAFARAAVLASAAEPPVEGFANCMRALALGWAGRALEAAELASDERGAALTRGECLVLQRFASYGICAELLARAGRVSAGLEAAEFALSLAAHAETEVNVFLAGLHGHAGVVSCLLIALEPRHISGSSAANRSRLTRSLQLSLARLRKFTGLYPAAEPRLRLLEGDVHAAAGARQRADHAWALAARAAQRTDQPHVLALARRALEDSKSGRSRA